MSLTSHLKDKESPVRRFLDETFPNKRPPLADCREAMHESPLILGGGLSRDAYSPIGTAIDYRIRYHFARLLTWDTWVEDEWPGAVPRDLWRARDADGAVTVWRVRDGQTERRSQASDLIACYGASGAIRSDDSWEDAWWHTPDLGVAEASKLSSACVAGFFDVLDAAVNEIAAHKRRPKDAEERRLARFCLVLAAFEAVFRAGVWPPKYFGKSPPETAEELLGLVPDAWVEDAAALGAAFSERYSSWHGANAVLNPTFAGSLDVGGADGDLITDGCLWEIKTTKELGLRGTVLHQLLGYLLLDYEDEHAIDRVGVLLPRQNTRVSWPVHELIATMSGRGDLDLAELRRDFRAVCEEVREDEERRLRIEMLEERLAEEEERRRDSRGRYRRKPTPGVFNAERLREIELEEENQRLRDEIIEMLEEQLAAERAAAADRRKAPD